MSNVIPITYFEPLKSLQWDILPINQNILGFNETYSIWLHQVDNCIVIHFLSMVP